MLKHLILFVFLIAALRLHPQDYRITADEINGEPLILGYCPAAIIADSLYKDTWTAEYCDYQADPETLDMLEGKLDKLTIKIVFRSTCSDSREQLPRLFRVLNELHYDTNSIALIGVNREKKGLSSEAEGLQIEFVPTIIFYKDGSEIGRIVETPAESLEKDLLKILS